MEHNLLIIEIYQQHEWNNWIYWVLNYDVSIGQTKITKLSAMKDDRDNRA